MHYRIIVATLALTATNLLAAPAKPADASAAGRAISVPVHNGAASLKAGIEAVRGGRWQEALPMLCYAADNNQVLADYALYYQAQAYLGLHRPADAVTALQKVLAGKSESRMRRLARLLYADSLAEEGKTEQALKEYIRFSDQYRSGADHATALLRAALCRERLGQSREAIAGLKEVWLDYPGSAAAAAVPGELKRVTHGGRNLFSRGELLKRADLVYTQGDYREAAREYARIPAGPVFEGFYARLNLKLGQALFKSHRYSDAEAALRKTIKGLWSGAETAEANLWLAKTLARTGRSAEAYRICLEVADDANAGPAGGEALLDAAILMKQQGKPNQARLLLARCLKHEANSSCKNSALWELAWLDYLEHRYRAACTELTELAGSPAMRDKALYWLGRSLTASGDEPGARAAFKRLAGEFPWSYYSLAASSTERPGTPPSPPLDLVRSLPEADNADRIKALLALGLGEDAAAEAREAALTSEPLQGAQALLLLGNHREALHALRRAKSDSRTDGPLQWGIRYPLAFGESVAACSARHQVPQSLIYSIIRAESEYDPKALSPVGAVGLMQVMPATAEAVAKGAAKTLTTPAANIRLGTSYLARLMAANRGDQALVAAAYNAGPAAVRRWRQCLTVRSRDEFVESIPYSETREYVKRVLAGARLYQQLYRIR